MTSTDKYDIQKFPTSDLQRCDPVHSFQQRVQNLSDEAQLKLSTDAGFVKIVALGQFFMTRDAEEFSVGDHVGYREYTPPRDNFSPYQKDGFVEVRKSVLYWK